MLIILVTGVTGAFSQTTSPTGTGAKVYLIRHTGYNGSALNFHCFIDSQLVCNLKNKRYSIHQVSPGTHLINVNIYKKDFKSAEAGINLEVEDNKVYYVKLLPGKAYSFKGADKLLVVSESTAKPVLAKCKEQTACLN
ncbi:DUF2846 domain-containing protein [Paraflavitalea pollutisoli]|uniref:DUF2846 domain-containing protein n=1 Tax=Paraflavitalea pollutisoli TaxID=3034143 RepID=UPI0023EB36FB|nr:DUF2846 domain-containing protein [Paraflavitalea sp. H1-2-19X]